MPGHAAQRGAADLLELLLVVLDAGRFEHGLDLFPLQLPVAVLVHLVEHVLQCVLPLRGWRASLVDDRKLCSRSIDDAGHESIRT